MYAVIDIETTGGQYDEEGITEIAILRYDGHVVVDKFVSLVNPEREIQPFVTKLTGINNKMLRKAPKFHELAKRIVKITEECVIVAHNASFDSRILSTEFRRLGYDYNKKTLCTVELSQELIPGLESYRLGNLCRALGIPVASRHRAEGDAEATLQLFRLLMEKDLNKEIIRKSVKTSNPRTLAPKLRGILDDLPTRPGIYYVHNGTSNIMFIGKGKNIRKAVNQLFLRTSKRARELQETVVSVTYQETGSELIAQLKYLEELSKNKPAYNFWPRKKHDSISFNHDNFIVIDRGRETGEKSVVLVENDTLVGYGYTALNHQLHELGVLKNLLTPMHNSNRNRFLVKNYLQRNNIERIIRF
jgi:DNA polymerase-3 subunit epsilon